MQLSLELRLNVLDADGTPTEVEPLLFELLRAIVEGGNLNYAAQACAVSYRHAWGLLRRWEALMGAPLVSMRQGRGARLSTFGEALLEAFDAATNGMGEPLSQAGLQMSAKLAGARERAQLTINIASSHGDSVLALKSALAAHMRVGMEVAGSESALSRYRRGDADVAGFHIPMGHLGQSVGTVLLRMLDDGQDDIWLLEQRVIGLVSRSDREITEIEQLTSPNVRFINRQPGSGTRLMFDALIGEAGIEASQIVGYQEEEYSHSAVAATVASGQADAGMACQTSAEKSGLAFRRYTDERFYLVMRKDCDPRLKRGVLEFLEKHQAKETARLSAAARHPSVGQLRSIHDAGV